MDDYPYLVAVALLDEADHRTMPLGGKSIKAYLPLDSSPGKEAERISLELMLRVLERSEKNPIQRAAQGFSLLLVEIPLESMQQKLPSLKSEWIQSGDSLNFINQLKLISNSIWKVEFIRYQGIVFTRLDDDLLIN